MIHYPKIRRPYRKRHNLQTTSSLSSPSATEIAVVDSNNLPSSTATSASVNQTENGISRDTKLQRTTDHPLNTDSNHLPSSSATSASVNQTENEISRGTKLQRTTDHPLNTDSNIFHRVVLSVQEALIIQKIKFLAKHNFNERQIILEH